jgi:phage terminase large subunit-like protein
LIKKLVKRDDGTVLVTRGSTFENKDNLAQSALTELQVRYAGTRMGRQELEGEILEDIEGALWTQDQIERTRIDRAPELVRVIVGVDPAVTSSEESDETGIVVAGRDGRGEYYILQDLTTRATPMAWAQRCVDAYYEHRADAIVAEVNNGGDMIPALIKQIDSSVNVRTVRATRGKAVRAEPIAALYEQSRVHHVGPLERLETQMTSWTPDDPKSPDRVDAMVWAMTELSNRSSLTAYLSNIATWCDNCNLPMPRSLGVCSNCGRALPEDADPIPVGA